MAKAMIRRGDTTMFWKDIWNFGSLRQLYPHPFSFTREPNCSVSRFLNLRPDYGKLFQLPLSLVASHQLAELMDSLEEWNREPNEQDNCTYIWDSGVFTSKHACENMKGYSSAPLPFHWLWKSRCQGKGKVLFWLFLNDRLNTRNLLRRKQFQLQSTSCVMCSQHVEETLHHLFFECEFAQMCWTTLHQVWDLNLPVVEMIKDGK
jgi:hypothetical protein